jgi:hypothetical protein
MSVQYQLRFALPPYRLTALPPYRLTVLPAYPLPTRARSKLSSGIRFGHPIVGWVWHGALRPLLLPQRCYMMFWAATGSAPSSALNQRTSHQRLYHGLV